MCAALFTVTHAAILWNGSAVKADDLIYAEEGCRTRSDRLAETGEMPF